LNIFSLRKSLQTRNTIHYIEMERLVWFHDKVKV
jgi:hypothetical protein